jgi:hypothetical protein
LFKGHQKVVLKTDGPIEKSLQYLRDWSFPKNFEKEFLLPLSLKLEAVNKKISNYVCSKLKCQAKRKELTLE